MRAVTIGKNCYTIRQYHTNSYEASRKYSRNFKIWTGKRHFKQSSFT